VVNKNIKDIIDLGIFVVSRNMAGDKTNHMYFYHMISIGRGGSNANKNKHQHNEGV
jgi:hypothetical protein